jgi:4-(gamma-glutamylamino)butanal dehydrogenase
MSADAIASFSDPPTPGSFPTQAFINGCFVDSLSGETFETLAPATGRPIASVALCDERDIDAAVAAGRTAFEHGTWRRASPAERKRVLLGFADLLAHAAPEVALLDCVDAGKPIADVEAFDMPDVINTLRWYAEATDKVFGQVPPTGEDVFSYIVREPIGVVGAVLPWNFPAAALASKVGPALAAGNSVVVKPAEQSPLSALRIAEIGAEAGLPEGVLNVVPGLGETAGRALGLSMGVDAVSFTGSTEVGREFLRYSADSNLKNIVLECGGKSAQIVMADSADYLDEVANELVLAGFWNMGENCTCGSRVLVDSRIRADLVTRMCGLASSWTVGDPLSSQTKVGPLIEKAHLAKVSNFVEGGRAEGASVAYGGCTTLEETGGWFFQPTILDNVRPEIAVAREEIFGPVISVLVFNDVEEAVALANSTSYGLAASIYTPNLDVAFRVAREMRAGTVSVNCYSEGDITTPFGGYKMSGFGGRDKGLAAFDQYTELKTVWLRLR